MSSPDRSAAARRLRGLASGPTVAPPRAADAAVAAGGASVPAAVRRAADDYARAHPDPGESPDDDPSPGGVRRPTERRRVRWSVSWRVAGAAALALSLAIGAVLLRSAALAPGAAVDLPIPGGTTTPGGSATDAASPQSSPGLVVVHVVGAVVVPGVVRLPVGSRVVDALAAAGGATADADLARLNLARVLVDGEQVVVPRPGDAPPTAAARSPAGGGDLVDLNTASLAQLDELPGVGPVLAQRIVDRRPFTSVDELDEVSGVGPTLLERLRPLVRA